jgi:cell division initiation protein
MKITPAEIKQKFFRKVFTGGFDREEVTAFLGVLSQEWEKVLDENRETRIKLDLSEKEVRKLKEIESSLFQTLKTAEDTSHRLVEQANRSAEMKIREVQTQTDALLADARLKARTLLEEAEAKSRQIMQQTLVELKELEQDLHGVERQKELLLVQIKGLATDTLEKVNNTNIQMPKVSLDEKIQEVQQFLDRGRNTLPPAKENKLLEAPVENKMPEPPLNRSFFDEISR